VHSVWDMNVIQPPDVFHTAGDALQVPKKCYTHLSTLLNFLYSIHCKKISNTEGQHCQGKQLGFGAGSNHVDR